MKRTDDELLALAAKAGGINTSKPWNPLTNSGDAFDLSVALNMHVGSNTESDIGGASWAEAPAGFYRFELHDGDPATATRRAIVRVAARIGELAL
jgi:hypothetical protein